MSYYQKYRPDRISDLDLDSARDTLLGSLKAGKLSHAYLLVGPRGSGKTSTARIISRIVNCKVNQRSGNRDQGTEGYNEPCGSCESCVSIKSGSAVDIMEIDAASNRGIDDIRSLREKARLAPAVLSTKVYIIDEVHQLSNDAFNALLKILEEPPKNVMFILCTTESAKVPATIVSRCTKIVFRKAGEEELVRALMRAAAGEGLEVEEGALSVLSKGVDGSFREAHKVLEQIAVEGKKVTKEMVIKMVGSLGSGNLDDLIGLVHAGDAKGVVEMIKKIEEDGTNVDQLVSDLINRLRANIESAIDGNKSISSVDKALANKLVKVGPKIATSPVAIFPLEVALLEVALRNKKSGGNKVVEVKKTPEVKEIKEIVEKAEVKLNDNRVATIEQVTSGWHELLNRLAPINHSLAGLLRSAKPKTLDQKFLTIEVFYKFHKEQLEQEARRRMVEDEMTKMWGPLSVKCVLGEKTIHAIEKAPEHDNITATVDDGLVLKAAEEIFGA